MGYLKTSFHNGHKALRHCSTLIFQETSYRDQVMNMVTDFTTQVPDRNNPAASIPTERPDPQSDVDDIHAPHQISTEEISQVSSLAVSDITLQTEQ